MKRYLLIIISAAISLLSCVGPKDGVYTFRLLTTNDVHGRYFDSLYVNDNVNNSLLSVSWYVDSIRVAAGAENVILVDAGDCLQGDNAAYYYNYVVTEYAHPFVKMIDYIGYDAVVVGNHDIETGHSVYDRIDAQMRTPFLAANAIRTDDGTPYFQEYVTLKRHGLRLTIWVSPIQI